MKERPILFSGPMVRAILDGRKTQTRRVIKNTGTYAIEDHHGAEIAKRERAALSTNCPYGALGDRLWVRENFSGPYCMTGSPPKEWPLIVGHERILPDIHYWADGDLEHGGWTKPKPSIHMPRWASRINLEITGIRVERLQDIGGEDAQAEGIEPLDFERYDDDYDWSVCPKCGGTLLHNGPGANLGVIYDIDCATCDTHKKRYHHLWESINGPGSWDANPWVWVVEFKRVNV